MKRQLLVLTLAFFTLSTVYGKSKLQRETDGITQYIDTINSIKIGNYWVVSKPAFELEFLHDNADTLSLVTCAEFVYSPFGK